MLLLYGTRSCRVNNFYRCISSANLKALITLHRSLETDDRDPFYSFKSYLQYKTAELERSTADAKIELEKVLISAERLSNNYYGNKYSMPIEKNIGALGLDTQEAAELRNVDFDFLVQKS